MTVKKRFISVAFGLLVALTALFGGFFAHQWWTIEQPSKAIIAKTPHITLESFDATPDRVEIKLKPDPAFALAKDYPHSPPTVGGDCRGAASIDSVN